jgi:hypothetical protein
MRLGPLYLYPWSYNVWDYNTEHCLSLIQEGLVLVHYNLESK